MTSKLCFFIPVFVTLLAVFAVAPQQAVFADAITYYVDNDYGNPYPGSGTPTDPFHTIQSGIDAASAGDTVLVADGTYAGAGNRDIDFQGKAVTVQSVNGPLSCIIDCQNLGRGFYFHNSEDALSVLSGFTIVNGLAGRGGGIYVVSASPTVTHCRLQGNTASFYGGGLCSEGNSTPEIRNCSFLDNTANYGGGVACISSSSALENCTFSGNMANYSGGAVYCEASSADIKDSTISENTAGWYGGGLCIASLSQANITDCTISNNTATDRNGGGLYVSDSTPVLLRCAISGNMAENGGGIATDDSDPTITNCDINMNSASEKGGGVYLFLNCPQITDCTFNGNTADQGGGMYCDSSSPNVSNTVISANIGTIRGGGVVCDLSSASFLNCIVNNNSGGTDGGFRISGGSAVLLVNSIISNNSADYGAGIGIYASSPIITNCTVSKNSSTVQGGGLRLVGNSYQRPEITNSLFWGDSPEEIVVVSGPILVTYSDVQGGYSGTGNIDTDPLFVDPLFDDFHLSEQSPCIDAATSEYAPVVDIEGTARWDDPDTVNSGGGVYPFYDIGAYEYYPGCKGDFEPDGDVDGIDLVHWVNSGGIELHEFAENFGRIQCL